MLYRTHLICVDGHWAAPLLSEALGEAMLTEAVEIETAPGSITIRSASPYAWQQAITPLNCRDDGDNPETD